MTVPVAKDVEIDDSLTIRTVSASNHFLIDESVALADEVESRIEEKNMTSAELEFGEVSVVLRSLASSYCFANTGKNSRKLVVFALKMSTIEFDRRNEIYACQLGSP